MPTLDLKTIRAALHEIVDANPDFVYPADNGCVYSTDQGSPSCGVGHVIAKLDPDLFERLHNFEYRAGADLPQSVDVRNLAPEGSHYYDYGSDSELILDADEASIQLLQNFQTVQDSGHSWGAALHDAEIYLPEWAD